MLLDVLDTNDVLVAVQPAHEALPYLQAHPGFTCRARETPPDAGDFLDPYPSRPSDPLALLLAAADCIVAELAALSAAHQTVPMAQAVGLFVVARPYVELS